MTVNFGKRRINRSVDDRDVKSILLGNPRPIVDARASERVHSKRDLGVADRRHVDNAIEIADIRAVKKSCLCVVEACNAFSK